MSKPQLGTADGHPVYIDTDRLVETRMLVTATSGAGKSWALRRILEQTHGRVQQIVIDPEDEFHTLREKYDYVLAGRHGGDCPADVRSAELLARKLLELQVSAIIGIYELQHHDRIRFVRLFLESLMDAPKTLWHPCLVVVDEAHIFAPQAGDAESQRPVIDLMSRGRKRGFAGLLATQRYSKLHKDAVAEAGNVMIGRSTLDIDVKRAADSLGFSSREDKMRIQSLASGEFFVYGPALTPLVTLVKVGAVETTHPKAGQRAAAPVAPRDRIAKVLGELRDLPAEAEKKAKGEAELKAEIQRLQLELRTAKSSQPAIDPAAIEKADKRGYERAVSESRAVWAPLKKAVERAVESLQASIPAELEWNSGVLDGLAPKATPALRSIPAKQPVVRENRTTQNGDLSGPEHRILDAIAWMESIGINTPEQTAIAFLAGYTYGGGGFNNPRGALRTKGLLEYLPGEKVRLTDAGRQSAKYPDGELTVETMHSRVLNVLPGPEAKILSVIINAYPKAISNEECASQAGYTAGAGGYNNPRGRLRTLGLIDYPQPGHVRARPLLFLEPES